MNNILYKFGERAGSTLVSFIVTTLLARILSPEDFGLVAIVTVFISIADVLVSNGFGSALIQKIDVKREDYSSILYINIVISLFLYALLYLASPLIASFFEQSHLIPIIRVMGIRIITASIRSIQEAYLMKNMMFGVICRINIISGIISGIVGIFLAIRGFGVWSIVIQNVLSSLISVLQMFYSVRGIYKLDINFSRAKNMLSFAWKLLFGSLFEIIGSKLAQIIIGKKFSAEQLGFYNKGLSFPELVSNFITNSISTVMYPVMSENQNDQVKLKNIIRTSEKITIYIVFPILFGLFFASDNIVIFLLTEKWIDCAVYVRVFSLVQIIVTINYVIQNAVCSIGKSNLKMIMDVSRRIIYFPILLLLMNFGVIYIALTELIISLLFLFVTIYISKVYLDYGLKEIFQDHIKIIITCLVMGILIYGLNFLKLNTIITLFMQIIVAIIFYVSVSVLFKFTGYRYIISNIRKEKT